MVGYLTTVKEAVDRDEQIEQVSRIIREWFVEYEGNERLRGFIERQMTTSPS